VSAAESLSATLSLSMVVMQPSPAADSAGAGAAQGSGAGRGTGSEAARRPGAEVGAGAEATQGLGQGVDAVYNLTAAALQPLTGCVAETGREHALSGCKVGGDAWALICSTRCLGARWVVMHGR